MILEERELGLAGTSYTQHGYPKDGRMKTVDV